MQVRRGELSNIHPLGARGCLLYTSRREGIIVPEESGSNGFGYDPIFFVSEYGVTMAELPSSIKNQISHRANALKAILPRLIQLFSELPKD